jgi:hypothetical protein
MFDFLHCFNGCVGRETRCGLMDRSADVVWIRTGACFVGSNDSVLLSWVNVKGCHVRLVMNVYVSCVLDFFYRMYIDLNPCDSWI